MKIKESEKIGKYLDLARELKKLWNKCDMILIVVRTVAKSLEKKTGGIGHQRDNQDNLDHSIVEISKNI